jgi:hypothetical protein
MNQFRMFLAELIFINKIEEYELAIEQAKKDEKDLASWLSHQ